MILNVQNVQNLHLLWQQQFLMLGLDWEESMNFRANWTHRKAAVLHDHSWLILSVVVSGRQTVMHMLGYRGVSASVTHYSLNCILLHIIRDGLWDHTSVRGIKYVYLQVMFCTHSHTHWNTYSITTHTWIMFSTKSLIGPTVSSASVAQVGTPPDAPKTNCIVIGGQDKLQPLCCPGPFWGPSLAPCLKYTQRKNWSGRRESHS